MKTIEIIAIHLYYQIKNNWQTDVWEHEQRRCRELRTMNLWFGEPKVLNLVLFPQLHHIFWRLVATMSIFDYLSSAENVKFIPPHTIPRHRTLLHIFLFESYTPKLEDCTTKNVICLLNSHQTDSQNLTVIGVKWKPLICTYLNDWNEILRETAPLLPMPPCAKFSQRRNRYQKKWEEPFFRAFSFDGIYTL